MSRLDRLRFEEFYRLYRTRVQRDILSPAEVEALYGRIDAEVARFRRETFLDVDTAPVDGVIERCERLFGADVGALLAKLGVPYLPEKAALYPLLLKNYFLRQLESDFGAVSALDFAEAVCEGGAVPN